MAHTILFNSSTGSDTQASGAGPATAVFGTNASYSGSVFTLDGSPDLSGVVAGDAILWVATSTGRQFFDLSNVNDGADQVTTVTAPSGTASGLTWAIGGKRATFDAASSRQLFVDAKPTWIIEAETDGALSLTGSTLSITAAGTTAGPIRIRGKAGAVRVCNTTFNGANFTNGAICQMYENIQFTSTAVSKTAARGIAFNSGGHLYVKDCIFGDATNTLLNGVFCSNSNSQIHFLNCEFKNCTGDGILGGTSTPTIIECVACNIHHNGGSGITFSAASAAAVLIVRLSLIHNNTGDGITMSASSNTYGCTLWGNTIHANGGDGVDATVNWAIGAIIANNIFSSNTGTGLKFAGSAAVTDRYVQFVDYNNFHSNGAVRAAVSAGANDQTLDPGYVNAATFDFRIGANLKGLGWPGTLPG